MLYRIFLLPARIAIHFYCKNIRINKPELLKLKGPVLIAANHPNSFLDAIILATLFQQPIYSLARGDAFINKVVNRILESFHMLPVYRASEGVENLEHNYTTFEAVAQLLSQNKIVLIFSEGRCINEWRLRPLKKGTARLALNAWSHQMPLKVLPCGINYSSFRHFGKKVIINLGTLIENEGLDIKELNGLAIKDFNRKLENQLQQLVYEIPLGDKEKLEEVFKVKTPAWEQLLLFLPAAIGYVLHFPLYFMAYKVAAIRNDDHYDSILVALLFLTYPLYILICTFILWIFTISVWALPALFIFPLTALCLLHYRSVLHRK